ncbi:MAG TPA: class I SAM-dependent methyltransferase [Vicinamibacterales bacterium]|jgi:SAM-dependent methyltransferase|nr:class I SAM-dependent methyltransferase [Vicinamibacterales bacterium]
MRPQPGQFAPQHASIFGDASVVVAYRHRPPYPPETFGILLSLIDEQADLRTVLDAGCGPGAIARELAHAVDRVDAVDIAAPMLDAGRALPGGSHPNVRWILGGMETARLNPPYALAVAASSLHWMHWETVLPRLEETLTPRAWLAVVEEVVDPEPWRAELSFIGEYSTNQDFRPYDMETIVREIAARGLFRRAGTQETGPMVFRQAIDAYVESFHARNGLSRERMGETAARKFDALVRAAARPHCRDDIVELRVRARVIWGKPGRPTIPGQDGAKIDQES